MICSCPKCNASYDLKDELVGKNLECPNCKAQFIANPGNPPGTTSMNSAEKNLTEKWIFGKNKYGIKQKKIAINEKYYIKDEENNDLFFSVRRIHFWRRVGAILLGIIVLIGSIFVGSLLGGSLESTTLTMIRLWVSLVVGAFGMIYIISIAGRRWIEFYLSEDDMNRSDPEFTISQNNLYEIIHKNYSLKQNDVEIARFEKNTFTDILRKKWHMHYNGKHILVKEDSVVLGILRRLWVPFIRTNFIFIDITTDPKSNIIIGYFKRKFEIFDNYLLDMTSDPSFIVPREIAICMAIVLDTGERR